MPREETEAPVPASRARRALEEVRSRPIAYSVLVAFMIAGFFGAPLLFPDVPTGMAMFGGVLLGVWAAFCALLPEFL
jgi:hypothetical protein